VFWINAALGQTLSNLPGAFSEVGFGVRPTGMGQAYTAISNDANAFLTNPAGYLLGNRANFTANYAKLFGLIPSSYLGLLYPLGKTTAMGGGFLYTGDDALSEYTLGVSFAFAFPNLPFAGRELYFDQMSFGITFKGRWASFGNNLEGGDNQVVGSGQGFGVDLGYMFLLNQNLSLGVIVRDLINSFNWDSSVSGTYSEGLPATVRFGGAYRLDGTTFAFDLRKAIHGDTADRTYFGFEHAVLGVVFLRGGFSNNIGTAELNRQWSFGMSIMPEVADRYSMAISAAYRADTIDNMLRFGLDLYWGKTKDRPAGRVY
jgi:hypothetical protein